MTMNSTGPISLGGCTVGQSINKEIGVAGTAQVSLNDANVRTLAGVASGAIIMPTNFYGKSFNTGTTTGVFYGGWTATSASSRTNLVTRINACGALIGAQTNIGCSKSTMGAAKVGCNASFYGGYSTVRLNTVTRIDKCGALVGSQTNVGTARIGPSGASLNSCQTGVYYTGGDGTICGCLECGSRIVTRINSSGAIIGCQTSVGTWRQSPESATIGSNGVYVGGVYTCCGSGRQTNVITRINACGALVGSEGAYTATINSGGGVGFGTVGVFGGNRNGIQSNLLFKLNACGATVGTTAAVGSARQSSGWAKVGSNGMMYAGIFNVSNTNAATRFNVCMIQVGTDTSIGTARRNMTGTGI